MARIKYFNTTTQQWEYADKAGMSHNHNDIYYTEAEVDAKIDELTEIFVQETEPENPQVGDIWVDISAGVGVEAQPLSILQGGTGATTIEEARANLGIAPAFSSGETILSSYQYGDTLPEEATEGRIFFKKAEM